MVKKVSLLILLLFFKGIIQAQSYALTDLEELFLKNNYQLLAQRYNIKRADAELLQEKVWSNPTLSISELNLWKNSSYEELPPLFGNYGKAQQISVELEQLIETAGKRKKRIAIKMLERDDRLLEYEDLLRQLKKELRQAFYKVERLDTEERQLQTVVELFEELQRQYASQVQKQNLSQADFYRVQSELVTLQRELLELQTEKLEVLSTLRILTHLPSLSSKDLVFKNLSEFKLSALPADLLGITIQQNIGLKRQGNVELSAEKKLALERAMRRPDITVQLGYDRGGNIMRDFIGVGAQVDLPIFNRNKGNIKAAQFEIEQERATAAALRGEVESTLIRLQSQLLTYERLLQHWDGERIMEQEKMWINYNKYLQGRQITLLEFVDFTQAFKEAQKSQTQLLEEYKNTYEELQYIVGIDF
ncbi:outer membrane protein, cobalt-zinc-cadmium efflux system [Sphingobacterium nematocida]|uniref:Outer membrane protein, cobalt-zinc-cadmium efflux system n=1 Tax=Sphingobacterium nematocida TaxID=1513896 RepID=A0A1T5GB47_9SPHI|nr:TolC family protein [Sphingobacterium nematocida]SKC05635.1 outer membrane protein, cobalt-zinc-cadmium efflux system [Sphingobacterium nematocida]